MRLVAVLALLSAAAGCPDACTPPNGPGTSAGTITTRAVEGGFELVLGAASADPVAFTAVQVDVDLGSAHASAIRSAGPVAHDVIEAGLADGARSTFTAVVSDTRRLPLVAGAIARIDADADAVPRLTNPIAVDDQGRKQTLTVVVP